jgi:hypothetical protein
MSDNKDIDKIIQRIRKCLALSGSSEPNEAAAALRQAQKLMEKFGISEDQVQVSEVKESACTAGRSVQTPPAWLTEIARLVSAAFCVKHFYGITLTGSCKFVFVGVGPAAEVASYTFTVLRRKCTSARDLYYRRQRGRRASRVRRADAYAWGWAVAVGAKVREFAQTTPKIIGQYLQIHHPGLVNYKPVARHEGVDGMHRMAGWIAGQDVDLHHGVAGSEPLKIGSN